MSCNRSAVSMCEFDGQTVCAWPVSLQDLFEHSPFVFCELAVSCILWAPLSTITKWKFLENVWRGWAMRSSRMTARTPAIVFIPPLGINSRCLSTIWKNSFSMTWWNIVLMQVWQRFIFFYFCINNLIWLIFYCIWAWKTMYCMCLVVPTCDLVTMWRVVN